MHEDHSLPGWGAEENATGRGDRVDVVAAKLLEVLDATLAGDPTSARLCVKRALELLSSTEDVATLPRSSELTPGQVRALEEYIDGHLASDLRADDLARVVKLGRSYFCHAFKATFGTPPHAFVVQRRIRRAQTLMLETDETLSQIAASCGLVDQAHLCRLFRRYVHETPAAWRRARRRLDG